MKSLKPEHRQILYLVYFEDFSVSQAAEIMKKASTPPKIFYPEQDSLSNQSSKRRASFMKNYNEIADSVFSRRDKALEEKANRRKTAKNIILPVVCLCAVIGAAIGIGQLEWGKEIVPSQTAPTAGATGTQHKIVINTTLPEGADSYSGIADICYDIKDYVPMTKDELRAFYGTEIFRVPDDMAEYVGHLGAGKAALYGIYRADGGTGDVLNDNLLIIYTNRESKEGRTLEIEISKSTDI